MWNIEKNQIKFPHGDVIRFDHKIASTKEVNGILVVLLDVPSDKIMTENVFGVSSEGKLLWQIESVLETSTDTVNSYTAIGQCTSNTIVLSNWNGTAVNVDVQTGKILEVKIVK